MKVCFQTVIKCLQIFGARRALPASGSFFQSIYEAVVATAGLGDMADASMTAIEELDLVVAVIAKVITMRLRR